MGNETFINNAQTTLNGAINSSVTSIIVTGASLFPSQSDQWYRIIIDGEIMLVTAGQGTTTWTVVRGAEGTSTALHLSGAYVTSIVTAQSLRELQWKDKIVFPSSTGNSLDDEFDDASLDPAWVRVDYSPDAANVTWTEGSDVLSMKNLGNDAATRYHALLKPLGGLTFPITLETATRHFSRYAINNFMWGVGFSTGTTYGAGSQILIRNYTYSSIATALRISVESLVNFNAAGQGSSEYYDMQIQGGWFYTRLIWTAANTFNQWVSIDGVSWINSNTVTYTITPTYIGYFTSNWGNAAPTIGTTEYIRVFTSNKAGNP